jgi:hypothetical protein
MAMKVVVAVAAVPSAGFRIRSHGGGGGQQSGNASQDQLAGHDSSPRRLWLLSGSSNFFGRRRDVLFLIDK